MRSCVYIIQEGVNGDVKIGWAVNPRERLKQLQTGNPRELRLLHFERIGDKLDAARVERWLHEEFRGHRIHGEWFRFIGSVRQLVIQCTEGGQTLLGQILAWQADAGHEEVVVESY